MGYVKDSTWHNNLAGINSYVERQPLAGGDTHFYKPFKLKHCGPIRNDSEPLKRVIDTKHLKQFYDHKGVDMQETALIEKHAELAPSALSPQEQVDKASEMAKVLQDVVNQADLAKSFGGKKKHLEFEAWQTIGRFFNCTPVTEWTKPIMEGDKIIGWESRVKVVDGHGRTIAAAENMCMRDEPNWKDKPNYALRSMSQTRAGGKALRSVFAFVAVLAGYSATPSEEMMDSFKSDKKQQRSGGNGEMTTKQWGAIKKAGASAKLSEKETIKLIEYIAAREGLEMRDAKICDFLLGKDDDGNWKIDGEIENYTVAKAKAGGTFPPPADEPEPDDIPI